MIAFLIVFAVGVAAGVLIGISVAPHVYLAHAEMQGIWPPKDKESEQ